MTTTVSFFFSCTRRIHITYMYDACISMTCGTRYILYSTRYIFNPTAIRTPGSLGPVISVLTHYYTAYWLWSEFHFFFFFSYLFFSFRFFCLSKRNETCFYAITLYYNSAIIIIYRREVLTNTVYSRAESCPWNVVV